LNRFPGIFSTFNTVMNICRFGLLLLYFVFTEISMNAQLKTALPQPENVQLETARPEIARSGVWMTYYNGRDLKEDFNDMKNHGVDAVEVGI
jgi:hypothetical protein